MHTWDVNFLRAGSQAADQPHALIILNQPFSVPLLQRLWNSTEWRCCADGGANRLHDVFLKVPDGNEARLRRVVKSIGIAAVNGDGALQISSGPHSRRLGLFETRRPSILCIPWRPRGTRR